MKKNGRKTVIVPVILMLMSIALFLYAPVSQYLDERIQLTAFDEYSNFMDELEQERFDTEWQKAVDYNNSLLGDSVRDPFIEGTGSALPENYLEILNVDGIMGYIDIPKISVLLPIYHGTSEEVLQKGAGHLQQTFMPIGGAGTHCSISAHTGLPNALMFDNLTSLAAGDHFYLHVLNHTIAYEVDEINVVLPYEFGDLLKPIAGEDHVTLITCTPFGVNSHRLLVRGSRIDYEESAAKQMAEEEKKSVTTSSAAEKLHIRIGIAVVAFVLMLVMLIVTPKIVNARRRKTDKSHSSARKHEKK